MTFADSLLALKWALRDIRGAWSSFSLVLVCLVIGLAAITTVHITAGSVLGSIQKNSRTILGADWIVRQIYSPVGEKERDWLKDRGAVISETAEMRPMLINPVTGDSALVELKVVDDLYPLYGSFTLTSGNSFSGSTANGIILEPSLRGRLNLKETGMLQLGTLKLHVSGWIANEPDRAGSGRFGLAPRVIISWKDFLRSGLSTPESLISYDLRVKWPEGGEPLADEFKAAFPQSSWRLTTHDNASPQIQRFVNNTLQFLTLVGLSALLIGGIGIANGLKAYFETRLTSIAIYKMIGTPQPILRGVYGWQIAILTCIGTCIGLVIGAGLTWVGFNLVRDMLPFPVDIIYTVEAIGVPAIFGILTMCLFSLWPFGQAERTSPLVLFRHGAVNAGQRPSTDILIMLAGAAVALSVFIFTMATDRLFALSFIMGAFICFLIYAGIGYLVRILAARHASSSSLMIRLALTNLGGPRNATVLTLISIGIGLTVLASVTLVDRNMRGILTENMPSDAPSFFFLDIQPHQKDNFIKQLNEWPDARNLIMTPNLRGRIKSVNGIPAEQSLKDNRERWLLQNDRGFTYMANQPAHSEVTSGAWWPADYKGPPLVSVVDDVERGFGVKPGDTITVTILGRDITATIANVREVNWTSFTINFAITFAPGTLESAPHNWLATVIAPPDSEADLQRAISKEFPNISMVRVSEAVKSIQDILGQMVMAVRIMAILALVTGIFVLAGALTATRSQRAYDAVILKVMGAPQSLLLKGLCLEFALLGIIAAGLAGGLGLAISWGIMGPLMDLGWTFYPATAALIVSGGFAVIFIAGIAILHSILKSPVRGYLQDE
ncbi:MAG: FtsX-like permease family protein [Alphaproteobacteria bacterium]|nr:FtsX-like permease family protein [Alphaproteobacteria bacterium]